MRASARRTIKVFFRVRTAAAPFPLLVDHSSVVSSVVWTDSDRLKDITDEAF